MYLSQYRQYNSNAMSNTLFVTGYKGLLGVKIVLLDSKSCWRLQKSSTNNWRRSKSWYTINIKTKIEDPLMFRQHSLLDGSFCVHMSAWEGNRKRNGTLYQKHRYQNSVLECKLLLRKALAEIYREVQFLSFFS